MNHTHELLIIFILIFLLLLKLLPLASHLYSFISIFLINHIISRPQLYHFNTIYLVSLYNYYFKTFL